ncbi:unknown [Crocosphaera subtropica ATCC 51142]|uniref:YbjN domain-containing protein n=2 Tax=Crocosphaera TaxID=263510 RepID=B1WSZ6_CROS5|nr:unknown [Crocosphaera subtropica ATCC 51142]
MFIMTNVTSEYTLPDNFTSTEISHQEAIETVIDSLQQNDSAMVHHDDQGYVWKFQYGSVETYVQLTGETEEDLLTVWSPVLSLPAKDELGLMRKLLEMNGGETLETRFGIMNNQIVVLSQRAVADLSPGEISRAITLVATIADDNDEKLIETYGGNPIQNN